MEALVLTSGTGGGHQSAAQAISETLVAQGHHVHLLDPYTLLSENTAKFINETYLAVVRKTPSLFGGIYFVAEQYRKLAKHSPVYTLNKHQTQPLADYLAKYPIDIVLTTHLFPAELLTALKKQGVYVPPIIYISTDYACIPFTEETNCDAYVVAHADLVSEFTRYGIPEKKVYPLGIPINPMFQIDMTQQQAKAELHLEAETNYWLIAGGTIGTNKMTEIITDLALLAKAQKQTKLIVMTGSKKGAYTQTLARYRHDEHVLVYETTTQMATYLAACDAFFTKPGGLSSTEALVMERPLIHIKPIPGVESKNQTFFQARGLSVIAENFSELQTVVSQLQHPEFRKKLQEQQRKYAKAEANQAIMRLAEQLVIAVKPGEM